MKVKAAVFRKVHEPLTIETIEMDSPRGREIIGTHRRDGGLP